MDSTLEWKMHTADVEPIERDEVVRCNKDFEEIGEKISKSKIFQTGTPLSGQDAKGIFLNVVSSTFHQCKNYFI